MSFSLLQEHHCFILGENGTLVGHTQPLVIGTCLTLASTQEFRFPNLLLS